MIYTLAVAFVLLAAFIPLAIIELVSKAEARAGDRYDRAYLSAQQAKATRTRQRQRQ